METLVTLFPRLMSRILRLRGSMVLSSLSIMEKALSPWTENSACAASGVERLLCSRILITMNVAMDTRQNAKRNVNE